MLFPEITGYDTQSFSFSIQYHPEQDTSIQMHTDASSVTLNINFNLPDEKFTGSEVDFYDSQKGKLNRVTFQPGVALIHKGHVPHAAHPIKTGERSNLVFWLYGDRMLISPQNDQKIFYPSRDRWTIPTSVSDDFAPF